MDFDSKYTGESAADRLAKVREKMKENGAEVHILTALRRYRLDAEHPRKRYSLQSGCPPPTSF